MNVKECNYLGLSDSPENKNNNFNLKATELRLGLPGSQSPERNPDFSKQLFPLLPSKDGVCSSQKTVIVPGNKRGFSDNKLNGSNTDNKNNGSNTNSAAHASKEQVVGWPPIRSFRKNTLATISKNNEEVDGKPGRPSAPFVKVSMDGAPYLRKVDLRSYADYQELSSALEKMFSCFMTIGQCGPKGNPTREMMSESNLRDLIHGSEYVLTYEDKDSDWMLVGDVPWEMFIASCKKLKIMKGSDAIGLTPRAVERSKNRK